MVSVTTRQYPQLVPENVVVKTNAARLVVLLVSNIKLLGRDFFQGTFGQPMSSLPSSVLDALEDHDGQHDEETNANHNSKLKI